MKWVKHDTDANQDAKLQNVLLDYGLEGYGLYWYCIELIAGKVDKENITFELEHDARIIARNTGASAQKVSEMMKYFVDIGLFENTAGVVTCLKLAKRLDKSMTSNPEMRDIIGNLKSHDSIMTESESVMQDKIRLDETRVDKNKDIAKAKRFTPNISMWAEWGWPYEPDKAVFDSWLASRKKLKAGISALSFKRLGTEFCKAENLNDCLAEMELRSWKGFKSDWMQNTRGNGNGQNQQNTRSMSAVDKVREASEQWEREQNAKYEDQRSDDTVVATYDGDIRP